MVRLAVAFTLNLLLCSGQLYAQVLMPPGGPQMCEPTEVSNGGQQSSTDDENRVLEVRADGAVGESHTSTATAGFTFEAVSTYPATVELGGVYAGDLSGGVTVRGAIRITAEFRDMEDDAVIGTHVVLDEERTTLGASAFNNILTPEVASFSHDLQNGRTCRVRLSAVAEANGLNGEADFLNANRRVSFSCLSVDAGLEDTDGDGIFDTWETLGIDIDNDGDPDLRADELGTDYAGDPIILDPDRKDILVELDWFECAVAGGDCPAGDTHTHEPRVAALDRVVAAFDSAPVPNPNGADDGVALWVLADEALPHQAVCDFDDGCFDTIKDARFGTVADRGDPDLMAARRMIWRYGLWVHDKAPMNSSSGEAEKPGNDFIVSLGSWFLSRGDDDDQTGTFMLELGHTLGLGHGGGGTENCKPNYLSVMSYLFQTSGLQRAAPGSPTFFDYSRDAYPTTAGVLIENALDENIGIEDDDFLTFFGPPINAGGIDNGPTPDGDLTDDLIMAIGTGPIDWDQNNASDDNPAAPTDINFAERTGCGGAGGTPDPAPDDDLAGHVDWDALQYNFRTSSTFEDGEHGDRPKDMDFETSESFKEAIWRARATRLFRYDAKILCGTQTDPDGLRLTQGRYGTVVNILNPGRRNARLRKSLALAYPPEEQLPGETFPISMDDLEPEHALKVDCEDVRRNVFDGSFPAPWIDGFVTVLSSEPLVVHGVYTTSAVDSEGVARGHSSIEIERYSGVDLSSDLRTRKRAAFLPIEIFDNYAINVVLFEITATNEGPADALDVRLDDTLRLFQSGGVVSVLMIPEQPADFPQGGSISVTQESPDLAEVRFVMGDIQNGSTRLARFLALVPTYRIAGATPPAVALVDTAEADFAGYEADPLDNSGTAIVELLP